MYVTHEDINEQLIINHYRRDSNGFFKQEQFAVFDIINSLQSPILKVNCPILTVAIKLHAQALKPKWPAQEIKAKI